MFYVFSKDKIISCIMAISTVVILFLVATTFRPNMTSVETSANMSKELPIYNVATDEKKVSLTINCAWNADDMESILDTLKKEDVKVTFFLVGDWVDKYPDVVKKINDEGHEIANHSDKHSHVSNLNYEKNLEEIRKCADKIQNLTEKRPTLYRGPYGEYNDTVVKASNAENHTMIQWNIDTLDYTGLKNTEMWKRIEEKLSPGSIILMHNGTENTSSSLPMIIENIKKSEYQIVPVSELIYKDNFRIDNSGTQHHLEKNE